MKTSALANRQPHMRDRTRSFYLACSAAAALGLALIGLQSADVLAVGPRPSSSALVDFLWALGLGTALGICFMSYQAHLYRRHRDFFGEFRSASLRERLRWRFQRWILLAMLPVLVGGEILVIVASWRELEPLPIWLGVILCCPLAAGAWADVKATAKSRQPGALTPVPSAAAWNHQLTRSEYARRIWLWMGLATAVAFAGYTLTLSRREEQEQAREFVRQLLHNGLAGQQAFYNATDVCRRGARTCNSTVVAAAEPSAREILKAVDSFTYDWNYGNALHYGNLVLGRLALSRGNQGEAGRYLLKAGLTPGSPQLGDYGPDMTLARDLLRSGQSLVVLRYLSLCNRFWKNPDRNCIDAWSDDVRAGRLPDFGSRAGPLPMPAKGWPCELIEGTSAVN